jgi:hypothetical protein
MLAGYDPEECRRQGEETLRRAKDVLRTGQYRWGEKEGLEIKVALWSALSPDAHRVLEAEVKRTGDAMAVALDRIVVEAGRRKLGATG